MLEKEEIDRLLAAAEEDLARLETDRKTLLDRIQKLRQARENSMILSTEDISDHESDTMTSHSSQIAKIALFRSLFRGREDVYARRYVNLNTGKTGYYPAHRSTWARNSNNLIPKKRMSANIFPFQMKLLDAIFSDRTLKVFQARNL